MKTRTANRYDRWQAAAACAALFATSAQLPAATGEPRASGKETAGVASGLAVGAAAGGPFGALIGAATGAWLGDRMHRQGMAQSAAEQRLNAQRQLSVGLMLTTRFRTDQTELRAEDISALQGLASLLRERPDLQARICGYTDPRGSVAYNEVLAMRRATAVAAVLQQAGVPAERLQLQGFAAQGIVAPGTTEDGTASAVKPDLDGYALERRVTVEVQALAERS